jgi:hypothetical protein
MFQSTEIIGRNQYDFAKTLFAQATEEVTGKVDYRLSYLDMPAVEVRHLPVLAILCSPDHSRPTGLSG